VSNEQLEGRARRFRAVHPGSEFRRSCLYVVGARSESLGAVGRRIGGRSQDAAHAPMSLTKAEIRRAYMTDRWPVAGIPSTFLGWIIAGMGLTLGWGIMRWLLGLLPSWFAALRLP